jgi:hypothetical protein
LLAVVVLKAVEVVGVVMLSVAAREVYLCDEDKEGKEDRDEDIEVSSREPTARDGDTT